MRTTILLAALLLTGCTPYKSSGIMGGFSETQLAPNVFRVKFRGNGFTSTERAEDLALLRAADLTLDAGYRYFGILAEGSDHSTQVVTTPGTASTWVSSSGNYASTTYTPGATFFVRKPGATNTIACFNENQNGDLFDAAFVSRSIRQKYGMKPLKADEDYDAEVRAFAADPKHPHFWTVRADMSVLLTSGEAKTLDEAYALATQRAGLK